MKHSLITVINAIGCVLLLGVVVTQWAQNENQRNSYRALQADSQMIIEARDAAEKKVTALISDIADLKASLAATQKAAEDATLAGKNQQDQLQAANTERDALRLQVSEWETAIKQRDTALAEQNAALVALRQRLDEAIAALKKAGAK
jgi:chromosome segregation ATPase